MNRLSNPTGLRISYTALSLWERGDIDGLLRYLKGERSEPTPQMLEGQKYDSQACAEALAAKRLTPEFGWYELVKPQPQLKLTAQLISASGEPFTLVGVIDVYDDGMIWELKTGVMTSASYARTKQTRLYILLCLLNKLPVKGVRIAHFDQYHNRTDVHKLILSRQLIKTTYKELLQTVADMQTFLAAMKGDDNEETQS